MADNKINIFPFSPIHPLVDFQRKKEFRNAAIASPNKNGHEGNQYFLNA